MKGHNILVVCHDAGGAGSPQHMLEAIKNGANAVAAASIFHFTEQTPAQVRDFLFSQGIPVRRTVT